MSAAKPPPQNSARNRWTTQGGRNGEAQRSSYSSPHSRKKAWTWRSRSASRMELGADRRGPGVSAPAPPAHWDRPWLPGGVGASWLPPQTWRRRPLTRSLPARLGGRNRPDALVVFAGLGTTGRAGTAPHPVDAGPRLAGIDPPSGRGAERGCSPGLARGARGTPAAGGAAVTRALAGASPGAVVVEASQAPAHPV